MYGWIWRHLPFGLPGKIVGSLLLVSGALSLLWFLVFPATAEWVEEVLLPFDQSTLEGDWEPGVDGPAGEDPGLGDPDVSDPDVSDPDDEELPDDHEIPYDTGE